MLVVPPRSRFESARFIPLPSDRVPECAAITDWLNCTLPWPQDRREYGEFFARLLGILGPHFAPAESLGRGLHGWKRGFRLGESGGLFADGGQRDTAFLSLSGLACSLIASDDQWRALRVYLGGERQGRITRWDGAVDDFSGVHSVDSAVSLYRAGQFDTVGRPPTINQHGNWLDPDGRGRTFEVGRRANGKMLRVYEKGMQLGLPHHPWVRWEVELHNKDREIPWAVLTDPGRYFVGAYPKALNWVSAEMSRIRTNRATGRSVYAHAVEAMKRQYGPLFSFMLKVEGSPDAVLAKLATKKRPRRLSHPLYEQPEKVCR